MKKELSAKEKVIIGIIALVISGILTSYLLVEHQKDWIMLNSHFMNLPNQKLAMI